MHNLEIPELGGEEAVFREGLFDYEFDLVNFVLVLRDLDVDSGLAGNLVDQTLDLGIEVLVGTNDKRVTAITKKTQNKLTLINKIN